jgi:predicted lipid-binding transport protein (Tim44 family)
MKNFLASMMIAVTAFSMVADAFARPVGGGRSFGRQSSSVSRMRAPAPAPAPYAPSYQPGYQQRPAPMAPQQVPMRRPSPWRGILGGALVGLGLGALFSHMGIGAGAGGFFSTLIMLALLALAVSFVVRMFRRRATPANPGFTGFNQNPVPASAAPDIGSGLNGSYGQNSYQGNVSGVQSGGFQPGYSGQTTLDKPHQAWGVPAGFDTEAFLRHAKSSFIRMQTAWDRGDLADLREFTAPEVFAELQMQIQERGNQPDYTEVVSIEAQLLGIETSDRDYLASVQFNGMIRNAPGAPAEPYVEVWNLSKPVAGNGGWVLAGIQQVS